MRMMYDYYKLIVCILASVIVNAIVNVVGIVVVIIFIDVIKFFMIQLGFNKLEN